MRALEETCREAEDARGALEEELRAVTAKLRSEFETDRQGSDDSSKALMESVEALQVGSGEGGEVML